MEKILYSFLKMGVHKRGLFLNHAVSARDNTIIMDINSFLKLYESNPDAVINARLILPQLGSKDLGKFEVPVTSESNSLENIYE